MLSIKNILKNILNTIANAGTPMSSHTSVSVTVPHMTMTEVGKFTLPKAGNYIIFVTVDFPVNATGYREVVISATSGGNQLENLSRETRQAITGRLTTVKMAYPRKVSAATTYYINAAQNSGTALAATTRCLVIPIGGCYVVAFSVTERRRDYVQHKEPLNEDLKQDRAGG